MKFKILAIIASTFCVSVMAQQNCDKPRDSFDGLYCLNKVYIETDADLNTAYKDLSGRLSNEGRAKLKQTQLSWIEDRNSKCSRSIDNSFFVNLRCATNTTRTRLEFIQERTRECKSSGCQPSKLQ
jgi:uncharacterized protein YecT (DUF1311 family)